MRIFKRIIDFNICFLKGFNFFSRKKVEKHLFVIYNSKCKKYKHE